MFFSQMKERAQKAYRIKSYDEVLTNTVNSMFVYRGLPDELMPRQSFIETNAILSGAAAIWKYNGEWIATDAECGGTPDAYGFGEDLFCRTLNGHVEHFTDWKNNPNVAVIFNNSTYSPDMNIGRFSDMLAELEVSMKLNILFARLYPIPIAKNTKIEKVIRESIKNMMDGKIATVLDEDALSKYIEEGNKAAIETVNISDVDKAQYIQYLAKMRDDIFRWFYSLYGMSGQGASKLAQQTVEEVTQDSPASMIIPHDMFRQRQIGVDMMNQKFGWNAEVSFSECWQTRLANFDKEFAETDEELEETNEEPAEEKVEEKEEKEDGTSEEV